MTKIAIGIDPGVKTGFAVWDMEEKKFLKIATISIVEAFSFILDYKLNDYEIVIRFEDARQRKWYGDNSEAKKQGAGSVKRDSAIWQEFCEYHEFEYLAVPPQRGATKWFIGRFKKITGWYSQTSEHARDAAMLVFGMQ